MKRISLLLFVVSVLYFGGCTAAPERISLLNNISAMKKVSLFLEKMKESEATEPELMAFISDSLMKARNLSKTELKVNRFYPDYIKVESAIKDPEAPAGMVVAARIAGVKDAWMHRLYFKVIEEGNSLRLLPGGVSYGYVDPWIRSDLFIKE